MADLTRMTVNLTPHAAAALDAAVERGGYSKTDTVNRALIVYDIVLELLNKGGGSLRLEHMDGTRERVTIL